MAATSFGCTKSRPLTVERRLAVEKSLQSHSHHATLAPHQLRKGLPPGAIIYGVIPGLLGHHPFQDLKDSMARMHDEGVDAVWISPINSTDEEGSLLSYSVTDYFQLRADFGSDDEFREVIAEAHRYGIRILMDFVANHTSDKHPYYQDVLKKDKDSAYYSFYDRDGSGAVTHYFDWTNLINLNYGNPAVEKMMKDAFTFWVENYGVDGFRIDAAWGVRERAPQFWPKLRAELALAHPDLILLAEASARDPYYLQNGFDLAYDWSDELGHWAWESVFQDRAHIGDRLHVALTSAPTSPTTVARFINNNDTDERFITRFGPGLTKLAATLQLLLPGVPVLYAGDEIGAEYRPYAMPRPIDWSKDPHALNPYYKKLIAIRKTNLAVQSESWQPILPFGNSSSYAFARGVETAAPILVVLNFAESSERLTLPMNDKSFASFATKELTDLLSGQKIAIQANPGTASIEVTVPAETAFVLIQ